MSSVQAIVHATTTLSQIQGADREALLLTHRKELESAFHNLKALLQPVVPPVTLSATFPDVQTISATCTSPNVSDTPQETSGPRGILSAPAECAASDASRIALGADTHKEDDDKILPDRVRALIKRLKRCEREILRYPYQPAQFAVSPETDWVFEDPRIVDISFLDKSKSPDTKFRSGLSALSLGDEYTEWERSYGTTRVDNLLGNLNSALGRKDAAYKEYVDSRSDRFKNKEKARKYIEYGVKFRVFERIYLARVEVSTHAGVLKAGTHLGVLGILFFVFNEFRRLRYDYLPMLANAILASQWRGHAEALHQSVSLCFESHKSELINQFPQTVLTLRNRPGFGNFPNLPTSKTRSGAGWNRTKKASTPREFRLSKPRYLAKYTASTILRPHSSRERTEHIFPKPASFAGYGHSTRTPTKHSPRPYSSRARTERIPPISICFARYGHSTRTVTRYSPRPYSSRALTGRILRKSIFFARYAHSRSIPYRNWSTSGYRG